jgi:hypothetical protein
MQSAREPAAAEFRWFAGQKGPWRLWVTRCRAFLGGRPSRAEDDKNRPKPVADREIFPHCLSPRDDQKGEMLKPQRHQRERLQWEPNRGVWTHQRMSGVGCEQGRLAGWVLASHVLRVVVGWVGIGVPPGLVGKLATSHGTKCKEL